MQLTSFTDYSLRVLIFLGTKSEGSSIKELCNIYDISKNHIVKVVHNLSKLGYLNTRQGKGGGIHLGMAPQNINLGKIVQQTETFYLVECFQPQGHCKIQPVCELKKVLVEAQKAFLQTLEKYTLEDVLQNKEELQSFFI